MKQIISFLAAILITGLAHADIYFFAEEDYHISLGIEAQEYQIDFADDETNKHLVYKPNLQSIVVPRIAYKKIFGVSWAFKTGAGENEANFFGETQYTDFRFDFSFNSFTLNTFYSQYSGFYIDNSYAINPTLTEEDPRVLAPDMYSRIMGAAITWVHKPQTFSLPNLMDQSERQEKMGGSVLFGASFTETTFSNDAGLIHPLVRGDYDLLAQLNKGKFQTFNIKAGYGWAWSKKWFFGGALQGGVGFSHKELGFIGGASDDGWEPSFRGEMLLAGGYNGDRFFSRMKIDAKADIITFTSTSSRIVPALASVAVNVGIHL